MWEATQEHRGLVIGLSVAAALLVMTTFAASVYGAGAEPTIAQKERAHSVRGQGGGAYLFFYSSGPHQGARGVGGSRGFSGGGFSGGK